MTDDEPHVFECERCGRRFESPDAPVVGHYCGVDLRGTDELPDREPAALVPVEVDPDE
jgi:hypothetical protein